MIKDWPRTMPKWLRGIAKDRGKILERTEKPAKKHAELLNIHLPVIGPQMTKHAKFILWFVKRHMN